MCTTSMTASGRTTHLYDLMFLFHLGLSYASFRTLNKDTDVLLLGSYS